MEWVSYTLSRGPIRGNLKNEVGLCLNIKAVPEVEEFMKKASRGNTVGSDAFDTAWVNTNSPDNPVPVYNIDQSLQSPSYTLGAPGSVLLFQRDVSPRVRAIRPLDAPQLDRAEGISAPVEDRVNLSILRIVGISQPEGFTIGLNGIYSYEYAANLRKLLQPATMQFLHDYLVPISINLSIHSKE